MTRQPREGTPGPSCTLVRPLLLPVANKMVGSACKRIVQLTNVSVLQNYLLPMIALPRFSIHNSYFGDFLFSDFRAGRNEKPGVEATCECPQHGENEALARDTGCLLPRRDSAACQGALVPRLGPLGRETLSPGIRTWQGVCSPSCSSDCWAALWVALEVGLFSAEGGKDPTERGKLG